MRIQGLARYALVDPGARAFAVTREKVGVEAPEYFTVLADVVKTDVVMPHGHAVVAGKLHAVELRSKIEQSLLDRHCRKKGAQRFIGYRVLVLLELLQPVGDVPGLEMETGKRRKLGQLPFCGFAGVCGQLSQERHDLRRRIGHLGRQRVLGKIAEAHEVGGFVPQREDALDKATVVPSRVSALVGPPRDPAAVQGGAQVARIGLPHDGVIGWEIEGEQPAVLVRLVRGLGGARQERVGQTAQVFVVGDVQGPGVRGVLDIVFEFRLRLSELLHDRLEPVLGLRLEIDTGQVKVAQRMLDSAAAFLGSVGRQVPSYLGIGALQFRILRQLGAVLGQQWQRLDVGLAPFLRAQYALQVTDRRPDAAQLLTHVFDGRNERIGAGVLAGAQQPVEFGTLICDHLLNRGKHVLGTNLVEAGQRRGIK